MNARVEERVRNWGTRPFSGGHAGLRELADEEFTGVVDTVDGTWLCLLNGNVVGVFGGRMDDLADADGTAHVAPHPALPLLFAMWEQGGTQEDRYYTKDTPISEADATLSSGGFAGYIELSDNVLSGDYYVCYYGDRSLSVAFVGANGRLITDEEAFERADDEIGIYDVYSVDLAVVEVPDPDPSPETGAGTGGAPAGGTGTTAGAGEDPAGGRPPVDGADDSPRDADGRADGEAPATRTAASHSPSGDDRTDGQGDPAAEAGSRDDPPTDGTRRSDPPGRTDPPPEPPRRSDPSADPSSEPPRRDDRTAGERPRASETPERGSDSRPGPERRAAPTDGEPRDAPGTNDSLSGGDRDGDATAGTDSHAGDAPAGEDPTTTEQSRTGEDPGAEATAAASEAPATPEHDPDPESAEPSHEDAPTRGTGEADRRGERATGHSGASRASRSGSDPDSGSNGTGTPGRDPDGEGAGGGEVRDPVGGDGESPARRSGTAPAASHDEDDRLRQRVRRQASTIDRLQERLSALEADREDRRVRSDRLSDRIEEVAGDLAELRRTVMRLDRTVERLEVDRESQASPEPTPSEAASTEDPSSDAAGSAPAPTERDAGGPTPAGDGRELSVEEALRETTVLVRYGSQGKSTLKTAHAGGADGDAVNDNLQLTAHTSFDDSAATVEGRPYSEFLRERLEYRFFEWLLRDLIYEIRDTGNGDALADLYDAIPRIDRAELGGTVELGEAAETESVRFDLVARDDRDRPLVAMNFQESRDPATEGMVVELQNRAKEVCEATGLAAAFLVTTSYFDGAAKDAAEAATSGRILSRSSKESFVRLNRKRGFHLCLAAVSEGDFHLRTPEL